MAGVDNGRSCLPHGVWKSRIDGQPASPQCYHVLWLDPPLENTTSQQFHGMGTKSSFHGPLGRDPRVKVKYHPTKWQVDVIPSWSLTPGTVPDTWINKTYFQEHELLPEGWYNPFIPLEVASQHMTAIEMAIYLLQAHAPVSVEHQEDLFTKLLGNQLPFFYAFCVPMKRLFCFCFSLNALAVLGLNA